MGIKDSTETWVRGKPVPAMVVFVLVGLVIGGLIGLAGGFKIEQSRTKSDVAALKAQIKAGGGTAPGTTGPLGQRVGKVTAVVTPNITVATKRQGTQQFQTASTTQFEQAAKGTTADIAVGRRVLVTINGKEVIVLPEGSKLGRLVTNVGSDTFSIQKPNGGAGAKLTLANVKTVSTLTPAKFDDIKKDATVLAGGRQAGKDAFAAVEVILLEPGSAFAS